jgi:hypothetical protein
MKSEFFLAVVVFFAVAITGCSGVKAPMGLDDSTKLQPAKNASNILVYQNPAIDAKKYNKFILEPVIIYDKEDNDFGNIPSEDRQMMAEYVKEAFIKAFEGSNFPIVKSSGPSVISAKFTLIGLTRSVPVVQGITYVVPYALAMNLAKGALGASGTFMGNTTLAAEFSDPLTGEIVGAFVAKASPNAMNIKAALNGKYGASKAAVTDIMEMIRKQADESHGVAGQK